MKQKKLVGIVSLYILLHGCVCMQVTVFIVYTYNSKKTVDTYKVNVITRY